MKKQRIVLASVLKPIDDTRMFEKLGCSLATLNNVEIYIIGYPSTHAPEHPTIRFIPHRLFKRLSITRLLEPLKILIKIVKVKPQILIVNTHELLIVGCINRILFGTKLIYDVQENYWRNILWTDAFPGILKPIIAAWVRLKEKATAPLIDWFLLAEKCYETEMNFFGKRFDVLENKSLLPPYFIRAGSGKNRTLLFSGTLNESTGVFETIRLAKELHLKDANIRLLIIGYCALPQELNRIHHEIQGNPFIELIGGGQLVPHHKIVAAIAKADFGIICYPNSWHNASRIPTKLFEYLHAQLPILLQDNPVWVTYCEPYKASIIVNFNGLNAEHILSKMNGHFYQNIPLSQVSWKTEEGRLLKIIQKFII